MKWDILYNLVSRVAAAAFGLVVSVVISRELGAEVKGDHALFVVGVAIIHIFTNLFGGSTLSYLAPRHSLAFLIKLSTLWAILAGGICGILLWILGLLPSGFEIYILISGILFACWNSYVALLLGRKKNTAYNTVMLINPLLSAILITILLYLFQHNLYAFANGYLVSQIITTILSLILVMNIPGASPLSEERNWKAIFKHGLYIQLGSVVQFLNYRVLYYLISDFFGKAFLGVYSNALALAESIWMVSKSISTVQFSHIINSTNDSEARAITRKYIPVSAVVSLLGVAVLIFIPASFYTFLFGKDFSKISEIILWLSPAIVAQSLGNIYAHYFAGKSMNQINLAGAVINLAVLLVCFFVAKPHFHELTAPFSVSVSFVATAIFSGIMYACYTKKQNQA